MSARDFVSIQCIFKRMLLSHSNGVKNQKQQAKNVVAFECEIMRRCDTQKNDEEGGEKQLKLFSSFSYRSNYLVRAHRIVTRTPKRKTHKVNWIWFAPVTLRWWLWRSTVDGDGRAKCAQLKWRANHNEWRNHKLQQRQNRFRRQSATPSVSTTQKNAKAKHREKKLTCSLFLMARTVKKQSAGTEGRK